jgi:hypothetical protein
MSNNSSGTGYVLGKRLVCLVTQSGHRIEQAHLVAINNIGLSFQIKSCNRFIGAAVSSLS